MYVDDIITSVPKDKLLYILDTFSSYNSNLKFTLELSLSIPFFYINIIRTSETIILTDWYQSYLVESLIFILNILVNRKLTQLLIYNVEP